MLLLSDPGVVVGLTASVAIGLPSFALSFRLASSPTSIDRAHHSDSGRILKNPPAYKGFLHV